MSALFYDILPTTILKKLKSFNFYSSIDNELKLILVQLFHYSTSNFNFDIGSSQSHMIILNQLNLLLKL